MSRFFPRLLMMTLALLAPTGAIHAQYVDYEACMAAFGFHVFDDIYPHPGEPAAVVIPAHPTANDILTVCTVDYVYSNEVLITRAAAQISVVVMDDGFSWSPNPGIIVSKRFGPLPAGNYTLDASVQSLPVEDNPPRLIASGIGFTVAPAPSAATAVAAPTLAPWVLVLLATILGAFAFRAQRRRT